MFVNFLENGRIRKSHDRFLIDVLHIFVRLDFVFFILPEPEESPEIRIDKFFTDSSRLDFMKVFFKELNLNRLLHFRKSLVKEFTERVDRLVTRKTGRFVDRLRCQTILDN